MKDEKIMNRLRQHLDSALAAHPCDWFVICLQGSQNYGLADKESDIDSKMLTLPSLRELALNLKPMNEVHYMPNNEQVCMKDTREYFKIFRKSNINFVEILFTSWYIVNPAYENIWSQLIVHREALARINPYATVSGIKGMASQKLKALCHEYPSRRPWIERFSYDPKQLSHLVRLKFFLDQYLVGNTYRSCLDAPYKDYLMALKRNGNGMGKEEAVELANQTYNYIATRADDFRATIENRNNPYMDKMLNDILCDLISLSIKKELIV